MTEDSSFHWPTKRRHIYSETSRQPVWSSFVFLDTTGTASTYERMVCRRGLLGVAYRRASTASAGLREF